MMANVVCRGVKDVKRSHRNIVRRATTAEDDEPQHKQSDPFHAVPLCALRVVAREFLTSATS